MRYATVTLTWADGLMHPVEEVFARDDAVTVEAIEYVSPGPGDEYVELVDVRGDVERAEALLDRATDVVEYDVTGTDDRAVAYVQCRTAGLASDLLAVRRDHEIVVDWPIATCDAGDGRGLKLTVVGTSRAVQEAVADLPAGVDFSLERTGEYEPNADRVSGLLTERQREVFELAVEEGYYDVPRGTTHRELAAALDVSTGTVSEHLQRIESKLVGAFVDSA